MGKRPETTGSLPGQFLAQHCGIAGERDANLEIHDAVMDQFRNLAVEILHALISPGFHGIEQGLVLALAFFDAFAGARIGFENFDRRDAPVAPGLGQ